MNKEPKRTDRPGFWALSLLLLGGTLLLAAGCTTKLVSPYDQKLVDWTDALYRKGAGIVAKGEVVSPRTNGERAQIGNPQKHPGHSSAFAADYEALLLDTDALILQAMAGSSQIGAFGVGLQQKVDELIAAATPAPCPELKESLGEVSLTAANFVDLKCLFLNWRMQHIDEQLTKGTQILKTANWEGRKRVLFNTVLAVQSAERFKHEKFD